MRDPLSLLVFARLVPALVLLRAGVGKLGSGRDFGATVAAYQILPRSAAGLAARAVPGLELGLGTLLLAGLALPVTAPAAALLLVAFAVAVAVNLVRGNIVDCGCTAAGGEPIRWYHVARNGGLAALCVLAGVTATGWHQVAWREATPALLALATTTTTVVVVRRGAALRRAVAR